MILAYCLLAEVKDGYQSSQSVELGKRVSSFEADETTRKWATGKSVPTARPMLDSRVKWLPWQLHWRPCCLSRPYGQVPSKIQSISLTFEGWTLGMTG
jgi:hypothetical protein